MTRIINKYEAHLSEEWDDFVTNKALNGTLYHTRLFLSYHKDRFEDRSIMIYDKGKLVAVFPCCKVGNKFYSHRGSAYGGVVVLASHYTLSRLTSILDSLYGYYDGDLYMSVTESIYFKDSSNDLLVFLLRQNCEEEGDISLHFDVEREKNIVDSFPKSDNKRVLLKHINGHAAGAMRFEVSDDVSDYENYYEYLVKTCEKNGCSPTHTLEEFLSLRTILKERQFLLLAKDSNNEILSGAYVFLINESIYYTVYLVTNYGKKNSQIFFTLYELFKLARSNNIRYVNLGACSKNGGRTILESKYKMKRDCGCAPALKHNFVHRKRAVGVHSDRLILKKMCRDEQYLISHLWSKNKYARDMFFLKEASITYDSQIKWFEIKNSDDTFEYLSIYTKEGIFIGYCGFTNITDIDCEVFIVILDADYYGMGLGKECIGILVELMGDKQRLYLHVKNDNLKAMSLYKKFAFVAAGEHNGVIRMELVTG
tara:strand:- start:1388 stop:2833 length:1446 start_codon:yes stop_codon:yes gene_type:complete